ncbi:uncharacterized protein LOC111079733 isoform X2 [Drosophila obscura]|uniref:uncharacterized protein LOC111079733 isoform X2 n=1 Tax=Drosophila obscura TaxID=7282 RepID=UPI001BB1145D|nr:uncharacterized protein LOC111079733 isoform X2 [Drosophila obscura]
MASNNRLKTGSGSGLSQINYKFTCRCCLKSDAEFLKLDTLAVARNLDPSEADKIPLLRCLLFCIRAENSPELPQYICVECSKSLQIAYYFLQNALRAHEILCRKLCPGKARPTLAQRYNGSIKQPEAALRQTGEDKTKPQKAFRHECKLCGFVVYNRMELKQHIRQHVDGSSYSCKVCSFVTLKQRLLQEHYSATHGMSANQADDQVKPKSTFYSATPSTSSAAAAVEKEVKVCTLEDMELLIPTVLTPGDYVQPSIDEDQLRDIEQQLAASMGEPVAAGAGALTTNLTQMQCKNMSIGSEYVVMPDGTLQINGGGVVIEYIDDSRPNSNTTGNLSLQNLLGGGAENEPMDIDVSELIVEEMLPKIKVKPKPIPIGSAPLKYKCKDCTKAFATLGRLKSHQLSHSHLPKFYCDQCPFYSLRSTDLSLHYKATHLRNERNGKEAGDESQTYSCDMCLFEGRTSSQLRVHYTEKHMIQPSEVQLRPSWTSESDTVGDGISSARTSGQGSKEQGAQPQHTEIPLGIQYPPAALAAAATVDNQPMLQHQQQQQQDQQQQQQQQPEQLSAIATQTSTITQSGEINVVVDATPLFYAATVAGTGTGTVVEGQGQGQGNPGTIAAEAMANGDTYEIFPEISTSSLTATQPVQALPTPTTSANISMFGDMQDFIDNTDVAAICTIPADDMPVVDGDDIVIDNNNISLDFDAENLFEEFDDEDEAVGEDEEEDEDDEEDEDAENEDENDNNDAATDQNLLLTSDDDDVDDFDDEQSKHLQKPYCIFCNKKFTSQYKFENHMFVHRGLAPYRCELCTNLYNMKRLLIRHYKTVHKRMPTRDMVQAKGDKVLVARTNIETIQLEMDRKPMLMCAKCPFECELDTEMRKHLNAHHGINDGVSVHANEVFIIRKLPFECPRCIRSFAAKSTLTRHLQRSHLVDTIIEMQSNQTTSSSAATTTSTTCTATTSMPANTADDNGNKGQQQLEMASTAPSGTETVGYGDGECEVAVKPEGAGLKEEPTTTSATSASTSASASSSSTSIRSTIKAESASERTPNPPDESSEPRTMNSIDHVLVKGETASAQHTATTASSSSSTPTPFDFDFDLMGDAGNSRLTPTLTPTTPSTSNKQIVSTALPAYTSNPSTSTSTTSPSTNAFAPSPLLNGSDKLLTAAMEPSPIKGLRSRMPRNPIYVCKLCKKSFDELGKLVKHEIETHSIGESARLGYEHRCGTCGTTYRTMALLKFHMKRHLNRKFSCKLCGKDFVHKTELDRHMLAKHATEKSFRCSLDGCRKMFAFKHHLVRHQNASHLKLRHVCSICQKEVKTSLHLRHHMTVHRGLTAYKCPKCDRTYLRRGALRVHALSVHHVQLTESELAEIFRHNVGYTNPHDMKVVTRNGQLVRRKELEAEREKEMQMGDEPSVAVANISK